EVGADALCISAEVAPADARFRADVEAAARVRGTHADRDIVLEAKPLGGVDCLDGAGGGIAPDDLPAHRLRRRERMRVSLARREGQRTRQDVRIGSMLPACEFGA